MNTHEINPGNNEEFQEDPLQIFQGGDGQQGNLEGQQTKRWVALHRPAKECVARLPRPIPFLSALALIRRPPNTPNDNDGA